MRQNKLMITRLALACLVAGLCGVFQSIRAEDASPAKKAGLPFIVFSEKGGTNNHYVASGWMGNTKGLKMDPGCTNNPHSGKTCLRFEYTEADDWAGIVWQDPANDWGDLPGGWNLTGAKKLKFWARGEKGGETVTFKFGLLMADQKYPDSASGEVNEVKLNKEWTEYTIDLAGKDLCPAIGAVCNIHCGQFFCSERLSYSGRRFPANVTRERIQRSPDSACGRIPGTPRDRRQRVAGVRLPGLE